MKRNEQSTESASPAADSRETCRSSNPMMATPASPSATETSSRAVIRSPKTKCAATAVMTGFVAKKIAALATVVCWIEAIHAMRCVASAAPARSISPFSPRVRAESSRRCRPARAAMMTHARSSRHAAIATGCASPRRMRFPDWLAATSPMARNA